MRTPKVHIGTSGWDYPHWRKTYYPEDQHGELLSFYAEDFSTVELNRPFYRLPTRENFKHWNDVVPDGFTYSVKASRFITHMKKLKDPKESIALFMDHIKPLKHKLGCILFQLPPGWKVNAVRLEEFLKALPSGYRYAFEFRNSTWYHKDVYDALKRHNAAFCIYELDGHVTPFEVTADFVYVRLHGPGDKYQGSYSTADLKGWKKRINGWTGKGYDVFLYFDNDQSAFAVFNAQSLIELMKD